MSKFSRSKFAFHLTVLVCSFSFLVPNVIAATDIGNGKLFKCENQTIHLSKNNNEVSLKKAAATLKRLIARQKTIISSNKKGSKKFTKAVAAKKAALQAKNDLKLCSNGSLGSSIRGSWNLILENGHTPAENGYNALTLDLSATTFISELDGPTSCHWEGTYTANDTEGTFVLVTTVGTGGAPCSNAVGQDRNATFELSEDFNTLTLDYRGSGGALQVYERVDE